MAENNPILIRNFRTGELEEGELVDDLKGSTAKAAQREWFEYLQKLPGADFSLQEHSHWDWYRKARYARSRQPYSLLGVIVSRQIQGMMLISDNHSCRLSGQVGAPMIYIDYLSVAPWNIRSFIQTPRFGGIGSVLVSAAIYVSVSKGFDGRVGLHSLSQADSFYERTCGMTNWGIDTIENGLRYFETIPKQSERFLKGQQQ